MSTRLPRFSTTVLALTMSCAAALPAAAQDLCGPLTRLLKAPPAGFLAIRGHPDGEQLWTAPPIVARAVCGVWQSQGEDSDTLRCTINDRAAPASVTAFYTAGIANIGRCLASLPGLHPWARTSEDVAAEGLKGVATTWVFKTNALRLQVSLSDYLRTVTNSSYNSLVVEYIKY